MIEIKTVCYEKVGSHLTQANRDEHRPSIQYHWNFIDSVARNHFRARHLFFLGDCENRGISDFELPE